jgi:hypothetical protein
MRKYLVYFLPAIVVGFGIPIIALITGVTLATIENGGNPAIGWIGVQLITLTWVIILGTIGVIFSGVQFFSNYHRG